ncbi:thioredoxin-like protein [Gonapodya prolifera JEL478]|uniref:Thioredoxin-like protein n=1 Tax=Gonapodya prolifera (strain JEL478) TaxID=1344416 RepID=A0A139AFN0_GONPJ|nr:thioredoxin-like protein [Gonapodya prolifera JEL478]|eukprot:KXS15225.1 thioredoxin-like protein [Gonapodya prolifera JEL478]
MPITDVETHKDLLRALDCADKVVVVEYSAAWCGACSRVRPAIDQLSRDFAPVANFVSIDVGLLPEVAKERGVSNLPSFHIHLANRHVRTVVGADPSGLYDALVDVLKEAHEAEEKATKGAGAVGEKVGGSLVASAV